MYRKIAAHKTKSPMKYMLTVQPKCQQTFWENKIARSFKAVLTA